MPEKFFDPIWYCNAYSDVALAGVEPYQHYLTFGCKEGRWPCDLPALRLEQELWAAADAKPYLESLQQLCQTAAPLHSALAAWVLARWHASFGHWPQALPLLQTYLHDEVALAIVAHQGPFLLAFSAYFNCLQLEQAEAVFAHPSWLDSSDKLLAKSMMVRGQDKLLVLNKIFEQHHLTPLQLNSIADLDQLQAVTVSSSYCKWLSLLSFQPKVTVIVPCFNASKTLATALNSLITQSYFNLEILIADDCSTDNSADIAQHFATTDKRVKLVQLEQNSGAYVARNTALQQASGEFITTHDADDWSHPQKIALQVAALKRQPRAMASVSHWVRCSPDLQFQRWRMEDGWIYRNVSSLLFRRKVVKALGFWDCVSVNADTEYYYRIKKQFGNESITEVMPGVPLSFGRADEGSLSQTKASHLRTQFRGLRKDYHEAALAWHATAASLYMKASPAKRAFPAPVLMCRGSEAQKHHNLMLILKQNELFDENWYLDAYPDVASAGVDPLQHFVLHGAAEGRDPNPVFSLSAHAYQGRLDFLPALYSWLSEAEPSNLPIWLKQSDLKSCDIAVVAHAAGKTLFGAERSLLDVLRQFKSLNLHVAVILPSAVNVQYIKQLDELCQDIVVIPARWWRLGRQSNEDALSAYEHCFSKLDSKIVYLNTCVLFEPALAAKKLGTPIVMHVREVADKDQTLCDLLSATSVQIAKHIRDVADVIVANSAEVARFVASTEKVFIIPNVLDPELLFCPAPPSGERFQLGLISSNIEKKGLPDVFAMAISAAERNLKIDFWVFGPETPLLMQLMQANPGLVKYGGYVDKNSEALSRLDGVLNLSYFAESFGRTVLEALATGRLVLAYKHGALVEILNEVDAILSPVGNWQRLLEQLEQTLTDESFKMKSKQISEKTWQRYSYTSVLPAWRQLFEHLNSLLDRKRFKL